MLRLISEIFDSIFYSIFYFIFIVFWGAFCLIVECLTCVICGIFSLIFNNPLMKWIGRMCEKPLEIILILFVDIIKLITSDGNNKEYNEPCGQGTYDCGGDDGGGE